MGSSNKYVFNLYATISPPFFPSLACRRLVWACKLGCIAPRYWRSSCASCILWTFKIFLSRKFHGSNALLSRGFSRVVVFIMSCLRRGYYFLFQVCFCFHRESSALTCIAQASTFLSSLLTHTVVFVLDRLLKPSQSIKIFVMRLLHAIH